MTTLSQEIEKVSGLLEEVLRIAQNHVIETKDFRFAYNSLSKMIAKIITDLRSKKELTKGEQL